MSRSRRTRRPRAAPPVPLGALAVALAAVAVLLTAVGMLFVTASGATRSSTASRAGTARADLTAGGPSVSIGVKLLQVPASESDDPRAHEYIIDRLPPGSTVHRQFQVADMGKTSAHVTVYPAAASIGGGSFRFAPGATRNELTTWIKVSQPVLNLGPHQHVTETATIAIPRDATRGEHYGVIWAQVQTTGPGNIKLVNRVGIRLYLSVGPGGAPPSDFAMGTPAATRVDGRPELRVPVRNTGGRAVDIFGALALSGGPGGLQAGPFRADSVVTLAPAQSGTVLYVLPAALPNGPWQALVTLQSGLITKTGRFTVDFRGQVAPASGFPVALTAGLAAAALVLILAGVLLYLRRRRRGGQGPPGSPGPESQGPESQGPENEGAENQAPGPWWAGHG